jgi:hypothetical protein
MRRTRPGIRQTLAAVLIGVLMAAPLVSQNEKRPAAPLIRPDTTIAVKSDSIRRALSGIPDSSGARRDSLGEKADTLAPHIWRTIENRAFGIGEKLVFDVSYGMITAGEAILEIPQRATVDGRETYAVEVRVNSLPSFSWIYKVEDTYRTFIDMQSIAPLRFEQHIREGGYTRDFVATFDQALHVASTTDGKEFPIPPYVHDIMSAFYYVRTIDFGGRPTGDVIMLQNFYKDKTHDLAVKILGRQELEVAAGTFNAIVLEPMVREGGLFKSEGRIVVWLSDDELKIPLRINSKVVIGSIDTELREYSGLRGRPTARIR